MLNNKADTSKIPYLMTLNNDSIIYDGDWEVIATGETKTVTYNYYDEGIGTQRGFRLSAKYAVWKASGPLLQGLPKNFQFLLKGQNGALTTALYYPETMPYVVPIENPGTITLDFSGDRAKATWTPGGGSSSNQTIYPSIVYSHDLSEYDILAYSPTDGYTPYVIYTDKQRTKWYCMVVGADQYNTMTWTSSGRGVVKSNLGYNNFPTISDEECININKGKYSSATSVLTNVNYIGQNQFLVFP